MTSPLTPETLVAVDYETHLITPETLTPRAVCLAVCEGGQHPRLMLREEGHEYLIALLRDGTKHVVGANIAFDLAVLCDARDDAMSAVFAALDAGRVHDVQVLEPLHLIGTGELGDEPDAKSGRFSLASLEQRYLGRNRDGQKHAPDAWRLRYAELDGVPLAQWPEEAITYPLADAEGTYRVALCQLFGEDRYNRHVEPDAMRVTWARHLEACRGVTTDPSFVESLARDLNETYRGFAWGAFSLGLLKLTKPTKTQQAVDLTVDDLLALAQSSVDPAATADARRAADRLTKGRAQPLRFGSRTDVLSGLVQSAYGGQPPLTPKGKSSTDHDTLAESGDELLQSYAEGKGVTKLLSTYVPLLQRGATAPIRPRARLVATMRASYSQPNLQNIPRSGSIRECFRPRPGFVWVSVDYSAQELCTLAEIQYQLFNASTLGEQINKGIDGHAFLGARLLGISYDDFRARLKSGDKEAKKYRQLAKPCLAGDTRVLTQRGWVPIVEVTLGDKVWDGTTWVSHRGLLRRGVKETVRSHGVGATSDHGVWTVRSDGAEVQLEWREVLTCPSLFRSALSLARLPLFDGTDAYTGAENQAGSRGSDARAAESSSTSGTIWHTETAPDASSASEQHPKESVCIEAIARSCQTPPPGSGSRVGYRPQSPAVTTLATQRFQTMVGEVSTLRGNGETIARPSSSTVSPCPDMQTQPCKWTASTTTEATSPVTSDSSQLETTTTTEPLYALCASASESLRMSCEVFDLADAGPRHRFTIMTDSGPIIVSNCNFGLPGGMSPPTLVASARDGYGVRFCLSTGRLHRCGSAGKTMEYLGRTISPTCVVCLEEAIRITEVWHATYPEMQPYLDIGRRLARAGKTIPSAGNGLVRLAESANAYNNHLFQNLAAQCTARALYAFTKECLLSEQSVLYGNAVPVLDIHDEIIAEVREEALTECAERQAAIQIEEMSRLTPHVRVSAEPAAMRRWFKGAELVRSKSTGRIVPWWPWDWDWAPDREAMQRDMEDAK